ncbi:hypothetical protein GH714_004322 [Hevea brasiliensis]|uniref:Uncharacterized protein n=1 Tax=Hevea brasiliensis TaxID=3981 RepID=A0A6A6KI27_HEVBR|nr:hypothetical protein GH714_004322 [Hevea brasiliensis]
MGLEAGLTFVIQAQPYINAVPIPLGLEALCLKACTHYPTLFDHFQRELRDVLQELQRKGLFQNWQQTESWKLLKELANSGLGGMHLVLFKAEGNHRLPPTTLSPGDMVCVRICDSRGAGATSCMQGFVNSLGEDGCSISVALESRHGIPPSLSFLAKVFALIVSMD